MSESIEPTVPGEELSLPTTEETEGPVPPVQDTGEETDTGEPSGSSFVPDYVDVSEIEVETLNEPRLRDLTPADSLKFATSLMALYTSSRELQRFIQENNGNKPILDGEEAQQWSNAVQMAAAVTSFSDDFLERSLLTEGAKWSQHIVSDDGIRKTMGRPKLEAVADGELLTGEAALRKVAALTSVGSTVTIPLPHTGIWITIKAPTLAAHTELDRKIADSKVNLGRSTRGLIFSNQQVYISRDLVDFALAHVVDATVSNSSPDYLRSIIKMPDLQILAWGLAYATYVEGFPIAQPCTYDYTKCMHVTEKMVALNRLFRVDNNRLTPKQRKRLCLTKEKASAEALQAYADEWKTPTTAVAELKPGLKVSFKVPTLIEHLTVGDQWIADIIANTENVLGPSVSPRERNEYIERQSRASFIQQYSHWIDKFLLEEDGAQGIISRREDIDKTCDQLSIDPEIVNALIASVIKYINDITVALIGIPNYPCAKCGKWHRTEHSPNSYLIPIDAVTTFFTLQQLKLLSTGVLSGE